MLIFVDGARGREVGELRWLVGLLFATVVIAGLSSFAFLLGRAAGDHRPPTLVHCGPSLMDPSNAWAKPSVPALEFLSPARAEDAGQAITVRPFVTALRADEELEFAFKANLARFESKRSRIDLQATLLSLMVEVRGQGRRLLLERPIREVAGLDPTGEPGARERDSGWCYSVAGTIAIAPEGEWSAAVGLFLPGYAFGPLVPRVEVRLVVAVCTEAGFAGPVQASPWLVSDRSARRPRLGRLAERGGLAYRARAAAMWPLVRSGRMLETADGRLLWLADNRLGWCLFSSAGQQVAAGRAQRVQPMWVSGAGWPKGPMAARVSDEMWVWPEAR